MRFFSAVILGMFLFFGVSGLSAQEPAELVVGETQQPTISVDEFQTNTLEGSTILGSTGGSINITGGTTTGGTGNMIEGGSIGLPATFTITGEGTIGGTSNITDGGSIVDPTGGSVNFVGGGVIPYCRELSAGTLPRDTIIESLKGMQTAFLGDGTQKQVRMAATVQNMVDFLGDSLSSLGALNTAGVEVTIEKEKDGRQINTLSVMNRDGMTAELKIVYPATGNVPASVKFNTRSIVQNGTVSAASIQKYVELYGDAEGQSTLAEAIKKLKKGGKITGSFYYWAPVPAASYMDFTSVEQKKGGVSLQRTLRVWGDGHVTYNEVVGHTGTMVS